MTHRYEDMFVPIPLSFLRQLREKHRDEVDAIAETYTALGAPPKRCLSAKKAIAISLFCTHKLNRYADEFALSQNFLDNWLKSYADRLLANFDRFPELFESSEWKVVVYICPTTLEQLKPTRHLVDELSRYDFVELQFMKHPSIGHGPGALWRLLAMSDTSLDEVVRRT